MNALVHELTSLDSDLQWLLLALAVITLVVGGLFGSWVSAVRAKHRLQQSHMEARHRHDLLEQEIRQKHDRISELEQLGRQSALEQQEKMATLQDSLTREHGQVQDLKARLEAAQKETKEKIELLQGARDQLKHEFQVVAQKLFEDRTEKFSAQNKQSMGEILSPLKEQLSDFRRKVEDVYDKETRDRVGLLQEIVSLKELNVRMSEDAINLTKALKGDNKAQGNWGEMVLEKVLEASGLQKGREYVTQGIFSSESGQRLRPDVIVNLPENKHIVIDSKVSLVAWERFTAAEDSDQTMHMRSHIESVKTHIKSLGAKNYTDLYGINAPDYVLLFIPIEPAFLKALEVESALFADAFEKNIMLVCPSTLLVTLKTIHNIWRYEHQNRNALEIAQKAGAMHDQFVLFLESLDDIGDKLSKAGEAYDIARKRIVGGRGNLIRRVEQLEMLGAKAKKSMPVSYLEQADAEVGEGE